ncbi:hypothetical protein FS749_014957 [Ceratobasidium sp. UAMH 11750]|nr:hypothetical protein FS749_014957 [Ceratobasidium sp. UAMH 11750]
MGSSGLLGHRGRVWARHAALINRFRTLHRHRRRREKAPTRIATYSAPVTYGVFGPPKAQTENTGGTVKRTLKTTGPILVALPTHTPRARRPTSAAPPRVSRRCTLRPSTIPPRRTVTGLVELRTPTFRARPSHAQEFEYAGGPSQQSVLTNMLSQRIDQVDQLRTQLAHAEARIASLSARSNPSAALAQAEARAEAVEARLAALKDGWREVEGHLDTLSRRKAEARAAFVRTLSTGEVSVPPSVPVFGAGSTSPYLPVRPPVLPNVPTGLGPTPFRLFRLRPSLAVRSSGATRVVTHVVDRAPTTPMTQNLPTNVSVRTAGGIVIGNEDRDLSPPIAAIAAGDDKDADGDGEEEVDQIVNDTEMAGPTNATRPRRSSDTAATAPAVRAGSAGAQSDGAVKDLEKDAKDPKDSKTNGTNGAAPHDGNLDTEGSPETDTDELSVDEGLLMLATKSLHPAREYDG